MAFRQMDLSSLDSLYLASGLLLVLSCLYIFATSRPSGLASIPGPFLASWSNIWKAHAVYQKDAHKRMISAHEKYGPVVRIGPDTVSFASPAAMYTIHGSRDAYAKSDFYKPTMPFLDRKPYANLFSLQDSYHHAALKRSISPLYTKTQVQNYESRIDSCTMLFAAKLGDICGEGSKQLDMAFWLHAYAFDSLGEINLSKKLGFLDTGTDVGGMMAAGEKILHMTGLYGQSPWLQKLQRILRDMRGRKGNPLLAFAASELSQRVEKPQDAHDLLSGFLELRESEPTRISIAEIIGALYINLQAGHDVLAVTLRTILYYLARSPATRDKLRLEIDDAAARLTYSEPIPYAVIARLPYLEAVIHEALRAHPNTGLILERVVSRGGATIDGYDIPGDTIVGVNAWVLHRDREIFGEDVDVFRAERWLEADKKMLQGMKQNLFSFGAGPRMCIGRNIAMMQTGKLLAEFYRRFDARLAHPEREWTVNGSWVCSQSDMDMIVSLRKGSATT